MMDNGDGTFKRFSDKKALKRFIAGGDLTVDEYKRRTNKGVFREGEEIELKGSRFVVSRITRHKLHLTLLPQKGGA